MLKSGKKDYVRVWKQHLHSSLGCSFCCGWWNPSEGCCSRLEGGRSTCWGQRFPCCGQLTPFRWHSKSGVPTQAGSHGRWGTESTCQMREWDSTHPFTLLPRSSSASWRGRLPLGTVGTATALKSQLKVTVSPPAWFPWGVKWYATSTDYFHLLGLRGAGGLYVLFASLCTEGEQSGWRSSPWMETLRRVMACSQTAPCPHSQRLVFCLKSFSYQKMWFQVKAVFVGKQEGPGHRDRCFSIFQGDEMKQKENLPPLEL